MADSTVDILMYHSISDDPGATSISPRAFADQMAAIAEAGIPVITMDRYLASRQETPLTSPHSIVLTFDDGFQNFADAAMPVLQRHGFDALVFLATDCIGRVEDWAGANIPPRAIMSWPNLRNLANSGVAFGSHSVTHANLNSLSPEALDAELTVSRLEIEEQLSQPCPHFAPPYGYASTAVQSSVSRHYKTSVGTRLDRATLKSDIFDLPRLEMYYFTDPQRWGAHLADRGAGYLLQKRILRKIRSTLMSWQA